MSPGPVRSGRSRPTKFPLQRCSTAPSDSVRGQWAPQGDLIGAMQLLHRSVCTSLVTNLGPNVERGPIGGGGGGARLGVRRVGTWDPHH